MRSAPSSSHSGNLLQDPFLVRRHLLLHLLQDSLQLDVLLLQDGELRLLLRQLPLPLCPAGLACPVVLLPHPPVLLLLRQLLFLFALQAWLARLFCSLILRYFSSSVSSSILIRLLFAFVTSSVFSSSTFTSVIRKLVVASSTSSGKAKLAIWVSSMIHLSRSSVSLDSTLLLLVLLAMSTGSSILPSASTAGRQSP